MKFEKMHGCGNDYIYVNGAEYSFTPELKSRLAVKLSDRHMGIGADGLIFINPSEIADFEMEMYNADGSRGEMCGNGMRCVSRYVYDHDMVDSTEFSVESMGKIKYIQLFLKEGQVDQIKVDMGEPILVPKDIPVASNQERFIDETVTVKDQEFHMTAVSMGNPHVVLFTNPDQVLEYGPTVENLDLFPNRVNAEFVEVLDRSHVRMRVWERGTGETLCCGTGCCATAVACILNGYTDREVTIQVIGGEVHVHWNEEDGHVYMTGPATSVFEGEIEIDV
ncbi:diaminopimelate epimerase [Eubacterium oxidoreducens]|uniref:Diaminopimelate epimerase n=1 Tax=Eubacterium oxidoreducens TaxID=1732 RepID=A0A1G6BNM8_EUBOX|nr:diaminopimelate epimerase [Eubacterium oxidoreducens]SDB22241.1 diaminopimelate epimerase [Eubacterium oxidoreducens]